MVKDAYLGQALTEKEFKRNKHEMSYVVQRIDIQPDGTKVLHCAPVMLVHIQPDKGAGKKKR